MSLDDEKRQKLRRILSDQEGIREFAQVVKRIQAQDREKFRELINNINDNGLRFIIQTLARRMMSESSQLYDFAEVALENTVQMRDGILRALEILRKADHEQGEYIDELNKVTNELKKNQTKFATREELDRAIDGIFEKRSDNNGG